MNKEVEDFTSTVVCLAEELNVLLETKNTISYDKIFNEIEGCLRQVEQWAAKGFDYSNAVKYQNQAEALIELIEVDVCNLVGGFDKGQKGFSADNPFERVSDRSYSRYKWLKNNYG